MHAIVVVNEQSVTNAIMTHVIKRNREMNLLPRRGQIHLSTIFVVVVVVAIIHSHCYNEYAFVIAINKRFLER
jgi:hypothetical protein